MITVISISRYINRFQLLIIPSRQNCLSCVLRAHFILSASRRIRKQHSSETYTSSYSTILPNLLYSVSALSSFYFANKCQLIFHTDVDVSVLLHNKKIEIISKYTRKMLLQMTLVQRSAFQNVVSYYFTILELCDDGVTVNRSALVGEDHHRHYLSLIRTAAEAIFIALL